MEGPDRAAKMRLGWVVFVVLVVLEVAEYFVGTGMKTGSLVPLVVLAVAAGWPIVRYYMHVQQLRRGSE